MDTNCWDGHYCVINPILTYNYVNIDFCIPPMDKEVVSTGASCEGTPVGYGILFKVLAGIKYKES